MSEDTNNLQFVQCKLVDYLNKVSSDTFKNNVSYQAEDVEAFMTNEEINMLFIIQAENIGMFVYFISYLSSVESILTFYCLSFF